jgi:endoglucanase
LLEERKMSVILDVHNYQMRKGQPIGGVDVPLAAYADLMRRLAERYKDSPSLWAYGLMNEPNGKGCPWAECAQAGIDAVREVDVRTQILVANDYPGWQCTQVAKTMQSDDEVAEWAESKMPIRTPGVLRDPANNLRFELHCYFDHDASGTYRKGYEEESKRTDDRFCPRVGPTIARDRLRPFVVWLRKHNARGFVGEYSVPAGPGVDERWMAILDDALAYMQENDLPSTFWAAGRHWSIKPEGNPPIIGPNGWPRDWSAEQKTQDRPQLAILRKYTRPLDP